MCQNRQQQKQQQETHHYEKPLRPTLSALITTITISNSDSQQQQHEKDLNQSNQKINQHQQYYHHYYHHHNLDNHYQQHLNHHQKTKTRHYFSRSGLVFLIFLTVIKDSLTTTHSSPYSLSLDITTTVSPTNLLPYFDFDVPRNITVTVGQTGFMHCRVERLGDKDVSWIRKRDLHILTAGSTTYTSDQRFQVLRPENSGNWTLQIKYPQPRDSGIYECQINTEPKMSLSYTFNVVELKATINGPTDLYVKSGSDINLTCKIMQGPHELGNIFWYKGSEIIDMTTNQNEIDSGIRITVENDWSDGLTSRLKIRRASSSDTGNYTCVPTIAKSSSVYVHVIIGEHPAAMQHNSSNMHCGNFFTSLCCMLIAFLVCYLQHMMYTKSNTNNMPKTTITILEIKRTATSISSLSVANATATAILALTPTSVSAALSTTTIKMITNTKRIPAVTKITQCKQCNLSLSPTLSSSSSSSSLTSSSAQSAYFYATTLAAVTTTMCEKTSNSTCNGRISR